MLFHMTSESANRASGVLLGLSALIISASVVLGIGMILSPSGGGFFPNLGKALGLLLIAAGNLLSWVLNLIGWCLARRRWLATVLIVQGLPAMVFASWLAILAVEAFQEERAATQRAAIYHAIQADDVAALHEAQQRCGKHCRKSVSPQRELVHASLHGAHKAARLFLDQGATPYRAGSGAPGYYDAHTSLYTCEGSYLVALNALQIAVARQDMALLEILWPASDARTRSSALWTAARLDRLDMVKRMTRAGVPLEREGYRGARETLLRPAASGAAVQVGAWLLETRLIAMPEEEAQAAMKELMSFMSDVHTPRSIDFGRLLLRHGTDIDAIVRDDETPLERAVRYRSREMVSQLLELGANPGLLSDEAMTELNALLLKPERPTYGRGRPGCVAP